MRARSGARPPGAVHPPLCGLNNNNNNSCCGLKPRKDRNVVSSTKRSTRAVRIPAFCPPFAAPMAQQGVRVLAKDGSKIGITRRVA